MLFLVTILCFLASCSQAETTPILERKVTTIFGEGGKGYPAFIDEVWPLPDSIVSYSEYSLSTDSGSPRLRGVGAEFLPYRVENFNPQSDSQILDKLILVINDSIISRENMRVSSMGLIRIPINNETGKPITYIDGGPYFISWSAKLEPGSHNARFSIILDDDSLLEYSWTFIITK